MTITASGENLMESSKKNEYENKIMNEFLKTEIHDYSKSASLLPK